MFELARRNYTVQFTDSRFPNEDLLVVSPKGKHFGIDVKGQRTKHFWQYSYKKPTQELFYAFVYVPPEGLAECFILNSSLAMRLWNSYKKSAQDRGVSHNRWGINWTQPSLHNGGWETLPR